MMRVERNVRFILNESAWEQFRQDLAEYISEL